MPVYASPATLAVLHRIFDYALTDDRYGFFGIPVVDWHPLDGPVEIGGHRVTRRPARTTASTWRPASASTRPTAARWPGARTAAACPRPRASVCGGWTSSSSTACATGRIPRTSRWPRPSRPSATWRRGAAWLIHMTHDLDHATTEAALPEMPEVPGGVHLAYDGLTVDIGR